MNAPAKSLNRRADPQHVRTSDFERMEETAIQRTTASPGHKALIVWQRAMDLVIDCYDVTRTLPNDERFGLTSQMRRAAVSIPSNIAEGHARRSRQAYCHHVSIALGSQSELETLVELCRRLGHTTSPRFERFEQNLLVVGKLLFGLHRSLRQDPK